MSKEAVSSIPLGKLKQRSQKIPKAGCGSHPEMDDSRSVPESGFMRPLAELISIDSECCGYMRVHCPPHIPQAVNKTPRSLNLALGKILRRCSGEDVAVVMMGEVFARLLDPCKMIRYAIYSKQKYKPKFFSSILAFESSVPHQICWACYLVGSDYVQMILVCSFLASLHLSSCRSVDTTTNQSLECKEFKQFKHGWPGMPPLCS